MSLAQITEKIKGDAQKEAAELLAKAKTQAEFITQRADEEKDAIRASFEHRFELERPEIFRRREIVANLDVKKMMLQSSRDLIRDVYGMALDKLGGLDGPEYLALCEALLDKAAVTGDEEVQTGMGEKYLDKAWLDGYNAKKGTKLALSEVRPDIAGGFILTRGKIGINCSWDMLIQLAQEKQESDVVKRLFPEAQ